MTRAFVVASVVALVAGLTSLPASIAAHEVMHCTPAWLAGDSCEIHVTWNIKDSHATGENLASHDVVTPLTFLFFAAWTGLPLMWFTRCYPRKTRPLNTRKRQ